MKGENSMTAFDNLELDRYRAEAKEKWGSTDAYREFEEKNRGQSAQQMRDKGQELMEHFARLGSMRDLPADHDEAQAWAAQLQSFITENYYTCTKEILAGLGQMYVLDKRFRNNIDKSADGTAEFVSSAIKYYCNL